MLLFTLLIGSAHAALPIGYVGANGPCTSPTYQDKYSVENVRRVTGLLEVKSKPAVMVFTNCAILVEKQTDKNGEFLSETGFRDPKLIEALVSAAKANGLKIKKLNEAYNDGKPGRCHVGCRKIAESTSGEFSNCVPKACSLAGKAKVRMYYEEEMESSLVDPLTKELREMGVGSQH